MTPEQPPVVLTDSHGYDMRDRFDWYREDKTWTGTAREDVVVSGKVLFAGDTLRFTLEVSS